MAPRFKPVSPGESSDPEVNAILHESVEGWWADPNLFGMVAHRPEFLKAIIPVFRAMFESGSIPPYLKELMRIQTGYEWGCHY